MDNTDIKTLKLNVSTIKSPLSGGGSSLGRVGQEGTSKVGKELEEITDPDQFNEDTKDIDTNSTS